MSRKTLLQTVHMVLFGFFAAAALSGAVSWLTTSKLEGLVVGATVAAVIATSSAFVERIFPLDE